MAEEEKKPLRRSTAWRAAKELIVAHRWRLAVGAALLLIGRAMGLVLPASSKYINAFPASASGLNTNVGRRERNDCFDRGWIGFWGSGRRRRRPISIQLNA